MFSVSSAHWRRGQCYVYCSLTVHSNNSCIMITVTEGVKIMDVVLPC